MKNSKFNVTLIVPCYNEEANIQKGVLDKIGNYTKDDSRFVEVLIVDDGSTDSSKSIIKEKYIKQFPKFKLLSSEHQGKAFAIMRGIKEANGEYSMFADIDLATPIEEADKLIQEIENGYEIIIGSRKLNRQGAPLTRKLLSFGAILLREYFIGIKKIHDTQCGFKLFRTSAAKNILTRQLVFKDKRTTSGSSVSAGFDMEFLFLASKLRYKIKEVAVIWRHVETKNVTFIKDVKEGIRDILKIKYNELTNQYDLSKSA